MNRLLYWITGDDRLLGMDVLSRIGLDARLPPWGLLLAAIGIVILAVYLYRRVPNLPAGRRRLLTTLRAAALIALLLLLAGPMLRIEGEGKPSGTVPVVLDRTESMSLAEGTARPVRLLCANSLFRQLHRSADAHPSLRLAPYTYGDRVEAVDIGELHRTDTNYPAAGARTSLRVMLHDTFRDHRGAYSPGMLLLTDGGNNTAELIDGVVDDLVRRRVPLYFAAFGLERARDIVADQVYVDDIVFVQEKTKAFLGMNQFGFTGKTIPIQARFGDQKIDVPGYTPDADGDHSVPFEFIPEREGVYELEVTVAPQAGETSDQNNRAVKRVRVIRDRIRILGVFGGPSWDYRFLEGAFQRDRRVNYKMFLQPADRRLFRQPQEHLVEKLPATIEEVARNFDIIIFSRVDLATLPRGFPEIVRKFVADDGGSVVFLCEGADLPFSVKGTRLEPVLPVRLLAAAGASSFRQEMFKPLDTPYRFELVPEAAGNPLTTFDPLPEKNAATWAGFPPCYELVTAVEPKPSAITLVNARAAGEGKRIPAIAYHNYGRGLALYMGFDSSYRWRKVYGDRYFRDYWGKVVQFLGLPHLLGESAQARLMLDRLAAGVGERVAVTAAVRNRDFSPLNATDVDVVIRGEDGKEKTLRLPGLRDRPGLFRGVFYPDKEGLFQVSLPAEYKADPLELKVETLNREFRNAGMQLDLMTRLAERTGGLVFVPGEGRTPTNFAPRVTEVARAGREAALELRRKELLAAGKNVFEDPAYVRDWSRHILATVAERRPRQAVVVEMSLWDWRGLMWLAGLLLCTEYFFRKIWYLD
ncbi:MAG: hypothetical protein WCI17_09600 [bacterium]